MTFCITNLLQRAQKAAPLNLGVKLAKERYNQRQNNIKARCWVDGDPVSGDTKRGGAYEN